MKIKKRFGYIILLILVSIFLFSCKDQTGSSHNYSSEWTTSTNYHWHACTDDGCLATSDYAAHIEGEWETITDSSTNTTTRVKKCEICGYIMETEETGENETVEHHYGNAEYKWSDNNTKCTASISCTDEGCTEKITETVNTVSSIKTYATCTSNRIDIYIANFTNTTFSRQTKDVEIKNTMIEHTYGSITYEWSQDYSECTAKHTCTVEGCNHVESEKVSSTSSTTKEATCSSKRVDTYKAVFENSSFKTQTTNVEIDEVGNHLYNQVVIYTWDDDQKVCKASRTCILCNHVDSEVGTKGEIETTKPASCTSNRVDKYTTQFVNEAFESQSKEYEILNTKGEHDYSNVEYTWASDHSKCTAYAKCSGGGCSSFIEETKTADVSVKTVASCTADRIDLYKADFENSKFKDQEYELTVTGTKTEHTYGTPQYTWSSDKSTCKAIVTCAGCSNKIEETGSITVNTKTIATISNDRVDTYTATFTNSLFNTQTSDVTIENTKIKIQDLFDNYSEEFSSAAVDSYTYTFAGGTGMNDITNYIPSLDCDYEWADDFEIQGKTLYYVGDDDEYKGYATNASISLGESTDLKVKALLETAYSYLYQGNQIQYDMYSSRRNANVVPEYATDYYTVFLDCSSFVNSVYYNTFGKNILSGYTSEEPTTGVFNTVLSNSSYQTRYAQILQYTKNSLKSSEYETAITNIKSNLQVGDLINFRHNETEDGSFGGHVLMYIGNNQFIHCTGSSYVASSSNIKNNNITSPRSIADKATSDEKNDGAICIISADELFVSGVNDDRYLFSDDYYETITTLFRPLQSIDTNSNLIMSTLTDDAKNRLSMPQTTIERSCDKSQYASVLIGNTVSFKITIKNNGTNSVSFVTVNETVPSGLVVTKYGESSTLANNTITWKNKTIPAGESIELTYTVKIPNTVTHGTIIKFENGNVNGISLNPIYLVANNDTDIENINSLKESILGDINTQVSEGSTIAYIINKYNELNINNSLYTYTSSSASKCEDILNSIFPDPTSNSAGLSSSSNFYNIAIPQFYGGVSIAKIDKTWSLNTDRYRLIESNYLQCGDIILTCVPSGSGTFEYEAYIYYDEETILGVDSTNNNTLTKITTEAGSKFSSSIDSSSTTQFLEQLTGYYKWVILRPTVQLIK